MKCPERIQNARSLLFVPGCRPDRFEKAARAGADALILDLEDSVPPAEKFSARAAIEAEWTRLQAFKIPLLVRINPPDGETGETDLLWLLRLGSPFGVMVPKAEVAQSLRQVHQRLHGAPVLPIIESAAGYSALPAMAAAEGVIRLAIGSIDFMADTGLECDDAESELAPLRFAVSMATRLHQLAPPVDGVTVQIDNDERLREDVRRALRYGFGGKLCIHPRQVTVVHEAMQPTEQALAWARKVIAAAAAAEGAAAQIDGRMVDRPVVLQARRTLARALGVSASSLSVTQDAAP